MRTWGRVLVSSGLVFTECARSPGEIMTTSVSPGWTRGLWQVWAILSSLWVATMTGTLAQYVFLVVRGEPHSTFQHVPVSGSVIIALGLPAFLFAIGIAGVWIARRFQRPHLLVAHSSAPF